MQFRKYSHGRLSWEVIIAGAIMGIVGAVAQQFGWHTSAAVLENPPRFATWWVVDSGHLTSQHLPAIPPFSTLDSASQ